MFPTSGYFRSITCPYFANGLCERPHCHFRHVKSDPPAITQPPRAAFDIIPTLSGLESVMGRGTEKPDLLMLVREAVLQVQKEVEEDRAKLKTGLTPTIESKNTQCEDENLIAGNGHLSGKAISKSSSSLPEYRPTPISELRKLQETQKPITSSIINSLEYDPTEGYSPSTSKTTELAEYRPSAKIPYVPVGKSKPKVRVEYVPKPVGNAGVSSGTPFRRDLEDDEADVCGTDPLESAFSDDDTGNVPRTKETAESPSETSQNKLSDVKSYDLVNMILTESKMCDTFISAASARKESQTSIKTTQPEKVHIKSSDKKSKTSKSKTLKSMPKTTISEKKTHSDKQSMAPKSSSKSLTSKKEKDKSVENKSVSQSKPPDSSKNKSSKAKSNSKSSKSLDKLSSKDGSSMNKTSKHRDQPSIPQKVCIDSSKKNRSPTPAKVKETGSKHHAKDMQGKHSSSSTKKKKMSSKDAGHSLNKDQDKHSESKKKKEIKSNTENGKIATPDKKSCSKIHASMKSPLSSCENSKGIAIDEIATEYSSSSVYDDLDTDLDEHDITEECLRIFNEYVPEEPDQSCQKKLIEKPKPEEDYTVGKKRIAHEQCGSAVKKPKLAANILPAPSLVMHNRLIQMQKMMREAQEKAKVAMPPPAPVVQSAFLSTVQLASSGKKRIAHVPNVKALLSAQRSISEVHQQHQPSPELSQTEAAISQSDFPHTSPPSISPHKISKGVPRVAHTPSATNLQRPLIPPEFGNRVPISIRQRYLNLLIDECLKIYDTEQDAFDRALAEEKNSYDRSSTRTVYLNVVANTIKKLRNEKEGIALASSPQSQETKSTPAGSNVMVPTPRQQHRTLSHEFVLGGKKAANTSYSIERHKNKTNDVTLSSLQMYKALEAYILTKQQLEENGYPVQDPNGSRIVIMKKDPKKLKLTDSLEKVCDRCGSRFCVNHKGVYMNQEECFYHWGRPYKVRSLGTLETRYSCCQGGSHSEGCSVARLHVFKDTDTENLRGYVCTLPKSPHPDVYYGIYALDCEMSYTSMGMELTRITVIGQDLKTVYESLVKPENPIVDYNSRFSGIMEGDLDDVKTSLRDVQAVLLSIFNNKTILIGHSLESDFKALKLVHSTVVDTSIVFPHRLGPPYKRALRNLTAEYLKKIIQNDVDGHDSKEDAASCMELMLWKVREDQKKCY